MGREHSNPTVLGTGPSLSSGKNPSTALAAPVPQRPQLFNFDAQGVRVVGEPHVPWFVAKDVCAALEIERTDSAIRGLEDDEKGAHIVSTLGGPQEMSTVNESGLYALIFRSRKPSARIFRRWVTNEVLPAIRKTGGYQAAAAPREIVLREPAWPLPKPATVELLAAQVFVHSLVCPRRSGLVHSVEIARAAVEEKLFLELCSEPSEPQHRARLLLFLRRFMRQWLQTAGTGLVWCEPVGKGRARRYSIVTRSAPSQGGAE
jgi:prophage antirepressor-like protein